MEFFYAINDELEDTYRNKNTSLYITGNRMQQYNYNIKAFIFCS